MLWKNFSGVVKDGDHAFLGASNYHWYNYDDEKLVTTYIKKLAVARGTALHDLACRLIKLKVRLPDKKNSLNQYVNDALDFDLRPEEKLYYSKFAFGTTDGINYKNGVLLISDLKTGKTRTSFMQLKIYAALFFLSYPEVSLKLVKKIELRIYQNGEIKLETPELDDILPIMDKIKRYSRMLEELEAKYDEGFDSYRSGS